MENTIKCFNKKHKDIDAIIYCAQCSEYMCNKCANYHSELFEEHTKYNLNKENKNFFTGTCNEENHKKNQLEYFCKDHNKLCWVACISKLKNKGNGQHSECNVCTIEEIKEVKKNLFNENIKYLKEFSEIIEKSISDLKALFEIINKDKEELKLSIQKIFTKLRNIINNRKDELLMEVDNKFDDIYFRDEIIKKSENFPNKIKYFLDKGKIIENEWNKETELKALINDCIDIENNINLVKELNKNIEKHNKIKHKIFFTPSIENIGEISNNCN